MSIAIVRPDDTLETLRRKVRYAAIFGTIQSCLTKFQPGYLRDAWRRNAEDERLLGVDLLGAMDNPILRNETDNEREAVLEGLRQIVNDTNAEYAKRLGIPVSMATTVIKPGGNSSARFNTGQSMSGWLAEHIIRGVEVANVNPLCQFLKDAGVPHEPLTRDKANSTFFKFPMKAPEGAFIVADLVTDAAGNVIETKPRRSAISQLEDWLAFKRHWTEHNPSVSIYVAEDEWMEVGAWVYKHWDDIGGLSFFPIDNGVYEQAPLTPVTREQYDAFVKQFPARIPWEELPHYDRGVDHTNARAEPACAGGACTF